MTNNKIYIEYKEELKEDFTKNYIEIEYESDKDKFLNIYFYNYEYGTINIKDGIKVVHRWENDDEAKSHSYLSRRYTVVFLNGIVDDFEIESKIIDAVLEFIKSKSMENGEMEIINRAVEYTKSLIVSAKEE